MSPKRLEMALLAASKTFYEKMVLDGVFLMLNTDSACTMNLETHDCKYKLDIF